MSAREYFVYRTYDADGQLLYVGCTKRLVVRWKEHKLERPRMVAETVRCRLQGPYTRDVATAIERAAIRAEEPLHGWSPEKHLEKCRRDKWIKDRVRELTETDPDADYTQAVREAREWFPDPYEHTYSSPMLGALESVL